MADQPARLTHLLDQTHAALEDVLRSMAPVVAGYYAALVQSGMPPQQAVKLALDAQRQQLAQYHMTDEEP